MLCLSAASTVVAPANASADSRANTFVSLTGEEGHNLFGGRSATFDPVELYFTHYGNRLTVAFNDGTNQFSWWHFAFAARSGRDFVAGPYDNAERSATKVSPELSVSNAGGCNEVTGRFDVLEVAFAADGVVEKLAIDFEHHCEGAPPALRGQIRYNASDTFPPAPDDDNDGVANTLDNCGQAANADQADRDRDGLGDACDPTDELSFIEFDSEPGEYIGGGQQRTWYPADVEMWAEGGPWGIGVRSGAPFHLGLTFTPPQGDELEAGPYEHATRASSRGPVSPGLDITGMHRGCNQLTGRFDILELVFRPDGSIERFAADFEQLCDSNPALLRGRVRINASATFPPAPDADSDGIANTQDNCRAVANPAQADGDRDGIGDACDDTVDITFLTVDGTRPYEVYKRDAAFHIDHYGPRAFIRVTAEGAAWDLYFDAPSGHDLVAGAYENARALGNDSGLPGLLVSGPSDCAYTSPARFDVLEAVYRENGAVERFAADIEQSCSNKATPNRMRIRYNASPNAGATATALVSDAASVAPGLTVQLTATVAPVGGRGTVRFLDGAAPIAGCEARPIDAAGAATCATSFDSGGTRAITAVYSGAGGWLSSTSAAVTLDVSRAATRMLTSKPKLSGYKVASVQVSATLQRAANSTPIAGRQIVFRAANGKGLCSAVTNASGVAACTVPTGGADVMLTGATATFAGDNAFEPSSSTSAPGLP